MLVFSLPCDYVLSSKVCYLDLAMWAFVAWVSRLILYSFASGPTSTSWPARGALLPPFVPREVTPELLGLLLCEPHDYVMVYLDHALREDA